ncbi:MAG: T9SS type A sorting domain-containing protein [Prolixibacteraceae bacterium]|nr:T9SS type A sorting domain-containing protein [Prolixibacteraceae bacterium]
MKACTPFITLLIILILQCISSFADNNKSRFSEDARARHKRIHRASNIVTENLKSANQYKYKIDSLIVRDLSDYEEHRKYVYYVDENNFMDEEIEFVWSKENKSWVKDYGYTYVMDGNTLTDYYWYWDGTSQKWVNEYACVCKYNGKGLIEEKVFYSWNLEKEEWDNEYYHVISYRDDGEYLLWIEYKWLPESNEWKTNSKWEYSYKENRLNKITGYYSNEDGTFFLDDEEVFTYDSGISFAESVYWVWDEETKQLEKESKYICTWNKDVLYNEVVLPYYFYEYRNRNMILEESEYEWDKTQQLWNKAVVSNYYYSGITTGKDEISLNGGVNVYPNPVSDFVTIENIKDGSSIDLYNYEGKKVKSLNLYEGSKFSMSEFSTGIYFLRISNKDKAEMFKVIKK